MKYVKNKIVHDNHELFDVGCSDGKFLTLFNDRDIGLKGSDILEKAIELAKAIIGKDFCYAEYLCNCEGQYDAISLMEVIEHISDDEDVFLLECVKRLSNNGKML